MNNTTLSTGQTPEATSQQTVTTDPETMVTVPREQLLKLIGQKRELTTVLNAAVDVIALIQELFGGSMPTTAADILTRVPRIMKAVKQNGDFMARFGEKMDIIKTIAPKHLSLGMRLKLNLEPMEPAND